MDRLQRAAQRRTRLRPRRRADDALGAQLVPSLTFGAATGVGFVVAVYVFNDHL